MSVDAIGFSTKATVLADAEYVPTRIVLRPLGAVPTSLTSTFIVKSVGGKGPSTRPSVQQLTQFQLKWPVPEVRSQ